MFASAISGLAWNFLAMKSSVPLFGRWYSHDIRPSANMFFERSASRFVTFTSFSASSVSEVSGTSWTW